ncbi:hypothetical protein OG21DRAFT_329346 [Imleria badia]|nr:hypothetical protein OG21DRAFT_329346 [Imleria badia]
MPFDFCVLKRCLVSVSCIKAQLRQKSAQSTTPVPPRANNYHKARFSSVSRRRRMSVPSTRVLCSTLDRIQLAMFLSAFRVLVLRPSTSVVIRDSNIHFGSEPTIASLRGTQGGPSQPLSLGRVDLPGTNTHLHPPLTYKWQASSFPSDLRTVLTAKITRKQ